MYRTDDDFIGVSDDIYDPEVEMLGREMGIDMSDPAMAGPFRKLFKRLGKRLRKSKLLKKLRKRIKARIRARRGGGKAAADFSLRTPRGDVTLGPEGIDIRSAQERFAQPAPGIMDKLMANPMMLAIPAGLILLLAMRRR